MQNPQKKLKDIYKKACLDSNTNVKHAFLYLVDYIQKKPKDIERILIFLLKEVIEIQKSNEIEIIKLTNTENLTIENIIKILDKQFNYNYKTHNGSKLPVLAFYAIFEILIKEVARYKNCNLGDLGSHNASDKTSKKAGDIEIFKKSKLLEAIEIKHNIVINYSDWKEAKDKIIKFNPYRYYILSSSNILESDEGLIKKEIEELKNCHGCQVIINGLLPTLKYYLRLISNLDKFINNYSKLIEQDKELKPIHKTVWNELLKNLDNI